MPAFKPTATMESLDRRDLFAVVPLSPSSTQSIVGSIGNAVYTTLQPRLNRTSGKIELMERTDLQTGRRRAITLPAGESAGNFPFQSSFYQPQVVAGRVFVPSYSGLWVVDDSAGVLQPVLKTGPASSTGMSVVQAGDAVYFTAAYNGSTRLFRTDGTARNTRQVTDVPVGGAYGNGGITPLVPAGDSLYFVSDRVLYHSDGTWAGTVPVTLPYGRKDGEIKEVSAFGNRLLVSTAQGAVYVTDGTTAGTKRLRSAEQTDDVQLAGSLGGSAFFTAAGTDGLYELWATNGTAANTRPISHFGRMNGLFIENTLRPSRIDPQDQQAVDGDLYLHVNNLDEVSFPQGSLLPTVIKIDGGTSTVTTLHQDPIDGFAVAEASLWTRRGETLQRANLAGGKAVLAANVASAVSSANGRLLAIVNGKLSVNDTSAGTIHVTFGGGSVAGAVAYLDLNGNARLDADEPSKTAVDYADFTGLAAGNYLLRVAGPAGWAIDRPKQTVQVMAGQVVTAAAQFARLRPRVDLFFFHDANRNGKQDAGERPVSGADAKLQYVANRRTYGLRSNSDGHAVRTEFSYEGPASVTVSADGWVPTTPATFGVSLIDGRWVRKSIGLVPSQVRGEIKGAAYLDHNGNGVYDRTGDALAEVRVYLDLNHDAKPSTGEPISRLGAGFDFTSVAVGTYTLRVDSPIYSAPATQLIVKPAGLVYLDLKVTRNAF